MFAWQRRRRQHIGFTKDFDFTSATYGNSYCNNSYCNSHAISIRAGLSRVSKLRPN